ncbi:oxidoreductase [Silvanigrella paludirubra]|uniref:Oxidoreductase n=1 Tax=Silvanigrella paludirubra TaxID=2499159 RepID=A0A6N6VRA8_9BACT|nr:Gfo/Idh/MocA family oxidoreductase [Silvanigrella paludirubra]KAB8036830.1 oxidoreductase [Silvanigrella paludirubra]
MSNIKISVVGCGYWGKNLVRNFFDLGVLDSVCDSHSELADEMQKKYNVPSLSFDQVLQSDVDGVVIAAPAAQHFALVKKALLAGKNVFVEKPISLRIEDAQNLHELAIKSKKILMVGHLLQYHPAFLKLKQLISEGSLGKLQYLCSNRLNLGKFRNEENILWSFAPHDISMILGLAGSLPDKVYATGSCHLNPNIHDVTTTHMTFKNGIHAHIFVSWLHPFKEQKLVVIGERGMAVFDDSLSWNDKLTIYPNQINWVDGFPQPSKSEATKINLVSSEPLKIECEHFIDCIQNKIVPRTDSSEGIRVLQVLEAAQKSLKTQSATNVINEDLPFYKHESALIDDGCEIGNDTKIWHFSHILKGSKLGNHCVIGQNVMIGPDVTIGNKCKIQNNVSLYKGVILEDGVFCGPSCVFTNVHNPRAEIERKDEFRLTYVERGVTIGANATIVCGVRLGAYCFVGAGAVVTKNIKPHALVVGNAAKQIGWMSHAGEKLGDDLICPKEGRRYSVNHKGYLEEIINNESISKPDTQSNTVDSFH